jgi:hypothetical protein
VQTYYYQQQNVPIATLQLMGLEINLNMVAFLPILFPQYLHKIAQQGQLK